MEPPAPVKLLYSIIARGTTVLSEHSTVQGNVNVIAVRILEKLPKEDIRVSYAQDRHMFHVLISDGITYMCMAEEAAGRRIPFAYLEDIRNKFTAMYGQAAKQAIAYEYNTDFSKVMAQRMTMFATDPSVDPINRVKGELNEVKNIMIENIEKVLDRGEKLDLLVDKTDHLSTEAFNFRRTARQLRRRMWYNNARMWAVVAAVTLFVVWLIVSLACGFTLSHC